MTYLPWIVIVAAMILLYWGPTQLDIGGGSIAASAPISIEGVMRIVTSLAVLGSALYVVLTGTYGDAEQKWAFGAIGMVLGHWLKR